MSTLISIILPVYNAQQYLRGTIESVLSQTHANWELLIIDDGSKDGSDKVNEAFTDERVRFFKQENKGVSAARNLGLSHMKGDYFCFLDADDQLTPNSLFDRLNVFLKNPSIAFVDGNIDVMNADFSKRVEIRKQTFKGEPLGALLKIDNTLFFGPTWMIKRFPNVHYQFKEGLTHGEDLLFYMTIAHLGKYTACDSTIYRYRSGNVSAMSNLDGLWNGYKTLYEEVKKLSTVSADQAVGFKKRIVSIMFKSYLGHGNLLKSMKLLIEQFYL